MIVQAPEIIESIIEIASSQKWFQTTISAIKFSQYVVQALWINDNSFNQLPHFTEQHIKHITKGSKVQAKSISEYVRIPDDEKKGLQGLSEEEKSDIIKACLALPKVSFSTKLFVEDDETVSFGDDYEVSPGDVVELDENSEAVKKYKSAVAAARGVAGDQVYEGDLITLKVTLRRENIDEDEEAAPVYAPYFPRVLREKWWLILTNKPKGKKASDPVPECTIMNMEKITSQSKVVYHEMKFPAPPKAGDYSVELHIFSDCYLGYDESIEIPFSVLPASELPQFVMHPDDMNLDKEPTLFEQMLSSNHLEGDSSDEEGGEEAKAKKLTGDDDDDEEDAEAKKQHQRKTGGRVKKVTSVSHDSDNQHKSVEVENDESDEGETSK